MVVGHIGRFYSHHLTCSDPGRLDYFSPLPSQVTYGGANKKFRWCRRPRWVIGCGEGGGLQYFLAGYVLLECNLMGLLIISM